MGVQHYGVNYRNSVRTNFCRSCFNLLPKVARNPFLIHAQNQAKNDSAVQSANVQHNTKNHPCFGTMHPLVVKIGSTVGTPYTLNHYIHSMLF